LPGVLPDLIEAERAVSNQLSVSFPAALSVEDAMSRLVAVLSHQYGERSGDAERAEPYSLQAILHQLIVDENRTAIDDHLKTERPSVVRDLCSNTFSFFEAAWELVRRGILVPSAAFERDGETFSVTGRDFRLTQFGRRWLEAYPTHNVVPTEDSRFSSQLSQHNGRFGPIYTSRSQEALGCYRTQHYLACCVMCGAAAEAIALCLASELVGLEKAEKEYNQARGAMKLLNLLTNGRNAHIQRALETFLTLLKDWRDNAAHATATGYDEEIASLSLLMLLRFAHFADTRWDELTTP
jgi:hypothetical protein